jgi:hypothetical protein
MTFIKPIKGYVFNLFLLSFLVSFSLCLITTADAQPASQSGYNLIGTIKSEDFTGAVLTDSSGEQVFYRLHDKLPDGSQLVKVRDDSISLKGTDGTLYDMYISHERIVGSAVSPPSADSYASESAPKQHGPTPAQQERINKMRQRALERAQRRKNEDE